MLGRIVFTRLRLAVALVAMLAVPQCGIWAQTPAAPAAETHAKGDIAGDWQGTLTPPTGKALRIIAKFAKADKGWSAQMYSIDQTPRPFPGSDVSVDGSIVKFAVELIGGNYTGALSADGNTIAGTWTQG